ncbi:MULTISPECIES: LysR family transcriptional regulator [unclassified Variovorax]|jgi:DNA-binding transcriptional LysR family regulator|uniref:LysR family transcriptional regulator n=1 Tax=unclassified Variovorax TaxID=663243 RepID=UPI000F7F9675|nr:MULTISPECIES: LysR family transcriptional regulator [unclassified Variovorax]RSZ29805.1 LysR family transcriptional regulator [Variovorax sp. 553]RSZ30375.1 LysR family transcriptional regulator [Variovorax sp. 679]
MEWTVDQLRQFVTTAECGSFSAAARHLGKAQSAVSTAIGLLEVDLGVALFDRSRRNAQLSEAGQVLLLEARELLRQAEQLDQRARSLNAGNEAALSLALDEALPYTAIATLMREISVKFPSLELTLLNGTATEVADYVEQERASVAFHFDRGPVRESFDQRHIGTVPQGVFVANGHPLADGRVVRRKDLARHRQLLMHADDVHEVAYSPRVWRSDSFYSTAEMVADKLGWAVLPVNIAHYEGFRQALQEVPCPSLALPRLSVRMLWLQGRQLGATASYVQKRFTELLRDTPA